MQVTREITRKQKEKGITPMERDVPDEAGVQMRLPYSILSAEKGGNNLEKNNDPVKSPCSP